MEFDIYFTYFVTNVLKNDRYTNLGLTLLQSNSEVLNANDCEFISSADILNSNTSEKETNALKLLRLKNPDRVTIGQVNINSLRNKFHLLKDIVRDKIDVLMISRTKLDSSFPEAQFYMDSYSQPFRLDRTDKEGGITLFVRGEIPSKLI